MLELERRIGDCQVEAVVMKTKVKRIEIAVAYLYSYFLCMGPWHMI